MERAGPPRSWGRRSGDLSGNGDSRQALARLLLGGWWSSSLGLAINLAFYFALSCEQLRAGNPSLAPALSHHPSLPGRGQLGKLHRIPPAPAGAQTLIVMVTSTGPCLPQLPALCLLFLGLPPPWSLSPSALPAPESGPHYLACSFPSGVWLCPASLC